MAPIEKLREKYNGQDIEFLVVYTREQHPGEKGYREYFQHIDRDHKFSYASELTRKCGMSTPVLVDEMDEKVHQIYGGLPNMVYIIDKAGKIAFKATWTQAELVDKALQQLTTH